jgi:predicted transcriptional regulator
MEFSTAKDALLYLITDKGYSKYKLAKMLGLSTSYHISNVLTGSTTRPHKVIKGLKEKFNITIMGYNYDKE